MLNMFKLSISLSFYYIIFLMLNKNVFNISIMVTNPVASINRTALAIKADFDKRVCRGEPICNVAYRPEFEFTKCMCDSNCNLYDDCCPDSPNYSEAKPKTEDTFICPIGYKMYMKKSCPTTFSNETIKSKCENTVAGETSDDPKSMKLVVDTQNNITYFNAYCAECNGITKFQSASISYDCRGKPQDLVKEIMTHVQYHPTSKSFYGVYNGTQYNCRPEIVIPDNLFQYMRPCIPNVTSSCPVDYTNQTVIELCVSHTSLIYTSSFVGRGKVYKNVYCATCNGRTKGLTNCQDTVPFSGGGPMAIFRRGSSGATTCDGENSIVIEKFC